MPYFPNDVKTQKSKIRYSQLKKLLTLLEQMDMQTTKTTASITSTTTTTTSTNEPTAQLDPMLTETTPRRNQNNTNLSWIGIPKDISVIMPVCPAYDPYHKTLCDINRLLIFLIGDSPDGRWTTPRSTTYNKREDLISPYPGQERHLIAKNEIGDKREKRKEIKGNKSIPTMMLPHPNNDQQDHQG